MPVRLTQSQVDSFRENGFLAPLPLFSASEMQEINNDLPQLLDLLQPGETTKEIREWHEASQYLFDICMNPVLLDYAEDILETSFYMWASNFFIKEPRISETVGWHQDSYYWPLKPIESITAWIAFDDVNAGNGAMVVLPGSQKGGLVTHQRVENSASVLSLQVDAGPFDQDSAVRLNLACGEVSLHDDKLLHASPANPSDRRRAGFTVRYSPNHVICDLSVNPHFRIYQARGEKCLDNPHGEPPTQRFGRLWREHQSIEESGEEKEDTFWKENRM